MRRLFFGIRILLAFVVGFAVLFGGALAAFHAQVGFLPWIVAAVALVLASLLSVWISRHVSAGVRDLLEGTERVACGDYDHRITVSSTDEFGHLALAFNRMAEDLKTNENLRKKMEKERQRALTQMVVGMAHEVNTPMGVVRTAASFVTENLTNDSIASIARDEAGQSALRDVQEAAALIEKNVARIANLVQTFRGMSVSQLTDTRENVDLPALVGEIVGLFKIGTRETILDVEVRDRIPAGEREWTGFPGHLSQVLVNLLTNVERYAYPDGGRGKVEINLSVDGENFEIAVRDFGRGIAAADVKKVFEPFFTTGRERGGTGLGLAIVRNVVTGPLRGEIDVTSAPGKGATFRVRLPRLVPPMTLTMGA